MAEQVRVSKKFRASPERLYSAWLDSEEHSRFTKSPAVIDPRVGGQHSGFGGYSVGEILELEPNRRILKTWRTADFPEDAGPSRLDLRFEVAEDGTELVIVHTDLPDGHGARFEQGWREFYLEPMGEYFDDLVTATNDLEALRDNASAEKVRASAAARKSATRKTPAWKAATKKAPAKKAPAKKAAAKKAATKKPVTKKPATKKAPAKKAATKKPATKKAPARKAATKKAATKKAAPKKAAAKKAPAKKTATNKAATKKAPAKKAATKKPSKRR